MRERWNGSLDVATLQAAYRDTSLTPLEVVDEVLARIAARGDDHVWIDRIPADEVRARAAALGAGAHGDPDELPLFGLPFAVKDNIDLAGRPTTAACPEFAHTPDASATVVDRLLAAGAIPIGKTNLDQFATGLVGVRSPYGTPSSAFDPDDISGGSSSGSAVAVAAGLVSFALGTDTAGSGRIPAGCNNVIGLKPTPGLIPTTGVLPACRSLDCVCVFALTVADATAILRVVAGPDGHDAYVRRGAGAGLRGRPSPTPATFRFGVPDRLEFQGDLAFEAAFHATVRQLIACGGTVVEVPFAPFTATAALLYEGPWVVERLAAIESFVTDHPGSLHPVTAAILDGARRHTATDTFRAMYRLEELRRATEPVWDDIDLLLVPTAPTTYTIAEVEADPLALNTNLGHYTNFVNLLGLAALAVPAALTPSGRPFGVTLIGPGGEDETIAAVGAALHAASGLPLGATGSAPPAPPVDVGPAAAATPAAATELTSIAVVGAHLSGHPLNHQLTDLGATLVERTRTAPTYRLYDLDGGTRPGMVRVPVGGHAIEVEVWQVEAADLGRFMLGVPPPLSLGTVELATGRTVIGFLCESHAIDDAVDITEHGSWPAYLASRSGAGHR